MDPLFSADLARVRAADLRAEAEAYRRNRPSEGRRRLGRRWHGVHRAAAARRTAVPRQA